MNNCRLEILISNIKSFLPFNYMRLAAFEHVRKCGSDELRWKDLLARVALQGESAKGFLLALKMNHAAYSQDL